MPFRPESSYDEENRIWSGQPSRDYFSPDLSIGEIIFHEMRRHPKQIAQVSNNIIEILNLNFVNQCISRIDLGYREDSIDAGRASPEFDACGQLHA